MSDSSHRRTRNRGLKLAAVTSLACKGGSILLQLVAIPMAFVVLGEEAFGVYAMVSTLITFVILSELGVGPGLTNLLTKHIAQKDSAAAHTAFSTAFFLTLGLSLLGCFALILAVSLLPVPTLFGERFAPFAGEMRQAIYLGVGIVFLKLLSSLGERARAAYQETFVTNLYGAIANLTAGIVLVVGIRSFPSIGFMILTVNGALALSGILNLIHLCFQRSHLIPSPRGCSASLATFLVRDGLAFCATLSAAPLAKDLGLRLILGHLGGPAAVAVFDILERLLVFVFGFIAMFTFPLWPALSDAANRGDLEWIRTARKRLYGLAAGGALSLFLGLATLGPWAIHFWLRGELELGHGLLAAFGAYVCIHIWHHVHHIFLAALNSIRLVSLIVLAELPFFFAAGSLGYTNGGLLGLYLGLALVGIVSSLLFPYYATQRVRRLTQAQNTAPTLMPDRGEPMITAPS